MDIREILALEANPTSIKKIDAFLSSLTPNHHDYPSALAHLAYLTYLLGDINGSLQILFDYLELCLDKEKPTIYNTLIKIYYGQIDYDNAYKMIEAKKSFLTDINKCEYYEDLIAYYDKVSNTKELIRTLLIYLDEDISDVKVLKALIKLSDEYFKLEDYDHFKEKNKLVQALSSSLNENEIYYNACYLEALVLVKEGSYPKAMVLIDEILKLNLTKELRSQLLALKLQVLVELNEYRRASFFALDFEEEVFEGPLEAKINFAKQCVIAYEALNNRFNKNNYEVLYNNLLEEEKKLPKNVEKIRKQKQTFEFNFLKNQNNFKPVSIDKEKPQQVNLIHREEVSLMESGSKLLDMAEEFIALNKQEYSQFRDYLRHFFITLAGLATFDEAYLLTKNNKYYGYHYKKERLYEKKTQTLSLNDTVLLDVLDLDEEIIIPQTSKTNYYNIITNKLYTEEEEQALICFPLKKAAIMFTSSNDTVLTAKLNYEILKMACAYLELRWSNHQNELYLLKKHHDYSFMMEHIVSGYKKQVDNYVFLSDKACEMFNSCEALSIFEFYNCIVPRYLFEYKKVINDLLERKIKEATVRFASEATGTLRHYEESFTIDEDGVILSVINDITDKVKEEENAVVMAHYDPVSGTYNKSKLIFDLEELINTNKFSLFAFNIIGFKNYSDIYGYDFTDQLIFAVGKYLKEYDDDIRVYHFDGDKFIIALVNENDKRRMIKRANMISDYLTNKLKTLNYRLNIYFEVGILRYPTDTNEKSPLKLIDYLLSALSSAHTSSIKTSVACYSKEDYKKQFFQSQLVTHISEAIDNNHLALYYRQVVDVGANSCDHYYVSLNLSNYAVDDEMIYDILKKRKMVNVIERYMIHKGLFELSEIYKEIKLYMNISFKVSRETILDPTFKDYLLEQIKFFGIPKSAITICYNDEVNNDVYEVLKSLVLNQILLASSNVEILKQFPIYYFYYKLPKDIKTLENEFIVALKNHCDKRTIRFVLENVNNRELIAHFVEYNISLYSGKVYSALLSSKDIIKSFLG